jgi:hypothetical protein
MEVRFTQPVYGEVLRRTIPPRRHRTVSAALGTELEVTGLRRQGDQMRLAVFRLDSATKADPALLIYREHGQRVLDQQLGLQR